jgi:ubiquitin-activating enzyme E1
MIDFVSDRLYQSYQGKCPSAISILGSVIAQEAIKGISQTYRPISQIQFFHGLDSIEPIISTVSSASEEPVGPIVQRKKNREKRRITQQKLAKSIVIRRFESPKTYPRAVVNHLSRMRVFIIGAGAIGCELLKTFALLGVGTASISPKGNNTNLSQPYSASMATNLWQRSGLSQGGIIISDFDSIEKSNLNRQLLYRESDIGSSKAIVAARAIRQINPNIRIHPMVMKVNEESEWLFNEDFWQQCDLVITALVSQIMYNKSMELLFIS